MNNKSSDPVNGFNGYYTGGIIFLIFLLVTFWGYFFGPKGDWLFLPLVGFIIAFPMTCRIRFKEDSAILYFGIFPSQVKIREVIRLRFVSNNPQYPDAPVIIYFDMVNGQTKRWELNFFPVTMRLAIRQALEQRVHGISTPPPPTNENLEKWISTVCKTNKAEKIIFFIAMLIPFAVAFWQVTNQRSWDHKVRTWDHVEGTITRNTTKRVKSGRRTREVSVIEYKYAHQGRNYTGDKIAYDSDSFPRHIQPGTSREIIVNPGNPQESAAMVYYRHPIGRYLTALVFAFIGTFFALLLLKQKLHKKPVIPPRLALYLANTPALEKRGRIKDFPVHELTGTPAFQEDRYCVLTKSPTWISIFWLLPLLLILPGILVAALPAGVLALTWGIILFFVYYPRKTIIDFQEKKIHFKYLKKTTISFDDWELLLICTKAVHKKGIRVFLAGGKKDSLPHPICQLPVKNLQYLLDILPELAEGMGRLPIVFK